MWCVYVHALNTSKLHAKERRAFQYASRCAQCGVELDSSTHVAAHAVRYRWPFFCPRTGTLTLVTTCRKCNSTHQKQDTPEQCCHPQARFWVCCPSKGPNLGRVMRSWCYRSHLADTNDDSDPLPPA